MQSEYENRTFWFGEYRDIAVTGEGRLVDPRRLCTWLATWGWARRSCTRLRCGTRRLERAVALVTAGNSYGHFNHDTFGCLIMWPKEVLERSSVVITSEETQWPYVREMLGWVVRKDQLVVVGPCEWLWVDRLHDMVPRPVLIRWPRIVQNLRQFAGDRFGLFSGSAPSRCILQQRNGTRRFVWNLRSVLREFARIGPEFPFEIWTTRRHDARWTVVASLRFYAALRFVLGMEGSNLVALLYMRAGAVVCEIRRPGCGYWYWLCGSWFIGHRHVCCIIPGMPHWVSSARATGSLDLNQARRAAAVCVGWLRAQRFSAGPAGSAVGSLQSGGGEEWGARFAGSAAGSDGNPA